MGEASPQIEKILADLDKRVEELNKVVKDVTQKVEEVTKERPLIALGAAFL